MANITVQFSDGTGHVYQNVPDNVTPDQVASKAMGDFGGKSIAHIAKDQTTAPPTQSQPKSMAQNILDSFQQGVSYVPIGRDIYQLGENTLRSAGAGLTGLSDIATGQGPDKAANDVNAIQANAYRAPPSITKLVIGGALTGINKLAAVPQALIQGGVDAAEGNGTAINDMSSIMKNGIGKFYGDMLANSDQPALGAIANAVPMGIGLAIGSKIPEAVKAVSPKLRPADQIVRGITQNANRADTPAEARALSDIVPDLPKNPTTPTMLDVTKNKIAANTKAVDDILSKDNSTKLLNDLTVDTKVNGKSVSQPAVSQALDQMESYYTNINDPVNAEQINQLSEKAKTSGLNALEVNKIAREHSELFNAFKSNGDLSDSVTKIGWENTRKGVKQIARDMINDPEAKSIDAKTSDLYTLKDSLENRLSSFDRSDMKQPINNPLVNAISNVAKYADTKTGSTASGLIRNAFKGNGSGLNAIELEKRLPRDIKDFKKANNLNAMSQQ